MNTAAPVAPFMVRIMGVTIEVVAPDPESRDRLTHQWERALVTDAGDDPVVSRIPVQGGPVEGMQARDYALTTELTRAALAATTGRRLNLHAGGLADRDGRVLAVVGPSGSGKTTATRLLAQRLAYLSDETVSIDADRTVWAHPKPLSVIVDPARPQRKEQLAPGDLGLLPTPPTGRLERLVVLHRGTGDRGLVPLPELDALLELIEQSSSLGRLPDPLRTLLRIMRACGGVWALEYDEIGDHLDALVDLLATDLPPADDHDITHHAGPQVSDIGEYSARMVARVPWIDAVEIGPDLVVLLGGRAVHLTDLTATLWLALTEAKTLDSLVVAARDLHGDHPDAFALVAGALDALAQQDLVAWGRLE